MAIIQPNLTGASTIGAATHAPDYRVAVFVKKNWTDATWTPVPSLYCISAREADIHGESRAEFLYDAGTVKQLSDIGVYKRYDPLKVTIGNEDRTIRDLFVAIRVFPMTQAIAPWVAWVGIIPIEQLEIGGTLPEDVNLPPGTPTTGGAIPTARQRFTAFGLEYLLARRRMIGAKVHTGADDDDGETAVSDIAWGPTFNERRSSGKGLLGNRSEERIQRDEGSGISGVTYGFSKDGRLWTVSQIIEYILYWSHDRFETLEPFFQLEADLSALNPTDSPSVHDFLNGFVTVLEQDGKDALTLLRQLIDPRRGVGARLEWSGLDAQGFPTPGSDIFLKVYSLSDVEIVANNRKLPKNAPPAGVTPLAIDDDFSVLQAVIKLDTQNTYDHIVVRGERLVSCFSAATEAGSPEVGPPNPGSLAHNMNLAPLSPAWPSFEEAAYGTATKAGRRSEQFSRVFTTFKLGGAFDDDFGWETRGATTRKLNPTFSQSGVIDINTNAPFWNFGKGLRRELPILNPAAVLAGASEKPLLRTLAVCELIDEDGNPTGRWVLADNPPEPGEDEDDDEARSDMSATIEPSDRNLELEVKFNPPHGLARDHLVDDEVADDLVYDYDKMIVTVAVDADSRPTVHVYRTDTHQTQIYSSRTLVIDVPNCEVWYVAPGTVRGVKPDGNLDLHPGGVVRDDTDRLREIAELAKQLYLRERVSFDLLLYGLNDIYPVGEMLQVATQNQSAFSFPKDAMDKPRTMSVVSSREWDFEKFRMKVITAKLNFNLTA